MQLVEGTNYIQTRDEPFPRYVLIKDVVYDYHGHHIVIRKGFTWDGATFGSFLFWRKSIHTSIGTLLHDWGYYRLGKFDTITLTRKEIDREFFRVIKKEINPQGWRLMIARVAIKIGGFVLWKKRKMTT